MAVIDIIQKLTELNPDLKRAEIEGILYILKKTDSEIFLDDLVCKTGIPKKTLTNFLNSTQLIKVTKQNNVLLSSLGKENLDDIDAEEYSWSLFELGDKGLQNKLLSIRKKYNIEPKREFDQFFATIETSIKKALVVNQKGLTFNNSIALIGDDDLVSVVLTLKYPQIQKVTVLEIDKNLADNIKKISQEYHLNIEVVSYDARNEIPKHLQGKFDVVLIDPPYTSTGIELFIDRSVSLLKSHKDFSGKYIFLNYGNSLKSPEKKLKVQEIINRYNLFIEDTIYKFNRYFGAESIGSASSLYILKTTPQTSYKDFKVKNIYTYEIIEEVNFPYVEQYTFKLLNVPDLFFKSINTLDKSIRDLAKHHQLKIVDTKFSEFSKGGRTYTYVLANSNLLVHTWPEFKAIHIDLVTCSPVKNSNQLLENLSRLFKTQYIDIKRVE